MTFVRFATLCNFCCARSEEYTAFPECWDCGRHVCPTCSPEGKIEGGDGEPLNTQCPLCLREEKAQEKWNKIREDTDEEASRAERERHELLLWPCCGCGQWRRLDQLRDDDGKWCRDCAGDYWPAELEL